MLSTLELSLLICAIVIILVLAGYAVYLLIALKRQKQQAQVQEHQQQAQAAAWQAHDQKALSSVAIIVKAMQAEQCDYAEGCWRLCVLLGSLKATPVPKQQFPAVFQLYNAIKALSILDARKSLSKQERMKEDLARAKAEAQFNDAVTAELPALLTFACAHENSPVIATSKLH